MNVVTRTVELDSLSLRVFSPAAGGRWPGVISYSDIFQLTGPHVRLCTRLAGHGFTVVAPELYGRFEPRGTVYDFERDRQRALDASARLTLDGFEADLDATLAFMKSDAGTDPARLLACGWCIGGHATFRAALRPEVKATACCYATGLHTDLLGGARAQSLAESVRIKGELLLVWGARDPHIPPEGRQKIHRALAEAGTRLNVRTYDAEHTFMRDEGTRYEPRAADEAFRDLLSVLSAAAART